MDNKHKSSEFLSAISSFVVAHLQRLSDIVNLAALEAQLAIRTLVLIAILIFILSSVLTACWIALSIVLFFTLLSFHFSMLAASCLVALANLCALGLILFIVYRVKDNLFFPGTCKQLHLNHHETRHARLTTKN